MAPSNVALADCRHSPENPPANIVDRPPRPRGHQPRPEPASPTAAQATTTAASLSPPPAGASAAAGASTPPSSRARGWDLFSRGSSNGAPSSLFQKAGTDTFYWVVGITVDEVVHAARALDLPDLPELPDDLDQHGRPLATCSLAHPRPQREVERGRSGSRCASPTRRRSSRRRHMLISPSISGRSSGQCSTHVLRDEVAADEKGQGRQDVAQGRPDRREDVTGQRARRG